MDQALYQSVYRWWRREPSPYLYDIPVPIAGDYVVTLHFAEIDPTRAQVGNRIVDIWVEGTLLVAGYDIVAEAGAAFTVVTIATSVPIMDLLQSPRLFALPRSCCRSKVDGQEKQCDSRSLQ